MNTAIKYHIDINGNPSICSASIKDCPRGGSDSHGSTKEEVKQKFEQKMKKQLFNSMKNNRRKVAVSPNVKNIMVSRKALEETVSKAMPKGTLSPAKTDEQGNIVKPELTYENYYAGTNKKHFLKKTATTKDEDIKKFLETPGSQFDPNKVNSLQNLVAQTSIKRKGGLEGDDREELIRRGADPAAFQEGTRYIITPVGGHLGSITSDGLSDDTEISFYEKTPGSNIISMTIEMDHKPEVDFGVLMMGPQNKISPNNPSDNDIVITAHPGLPSKTNPARAKLSREEKDEYDRQEHENLKRIVKEKGKITIGDIRKIKGRDFNLNVKLKS